MKRSDLIINERSFWKTNVDRRSKCWQWRGDISHGIGTLRVNGKNERAVDIAYVLAFRELPDGAEIVHSCSNPLCVNPKHFRLKNPKGRDPLKPPRPEHRVLMKDDADVIRARYSSGESYKEIADAFGVSNGAIGAVIRNEHVADPNTLVRPRPKWWRTPSWTARAAERRVKQ